jgi:1-acyl-sn-glycerol-3-phosphate acyltransferase
MLEPRLSALARALPASWGRAILARTRGLDLLSLLADCLVSYPADPEGLDPARAKRWLFMLDRTMCRYFRMTVIGAENLPPGRALVIGCHSGGLPWDAACLVVAIYRATGRLSRNAADRIFGRVGAVARFLAATGALVGDFGRLEASLARGEMVVLFPGGAKDMTRPIWERYQVKPHRGFAPGRGGYVKLALRTRSPIVPVAIVGAEETHVVLADIAPLARLLGVPYFPVFLSPVPLPARIYVRFGEPIRLDAPPDAAADQPTVNHLNDALRGALQTLIDDTRRRRRGVYWSSFGRPLPRSP